MKKIIIYTLFISTLMFSCRKEEDIPAINAYGFTIIEEAEAMLGNYAKFFQVVDGSVYSRVRQYNDGGSDKIDAYADAWFMGTQKARNDGGIFRIDDVEFKFNPTISQYEAQGMAREEDRELMQNAVVKMYNKEVKATLTKDGKELFQVKYYTPKLLNTKITNPRESGTVFHQITDSGVSLKWDKDDKNTNGVVVHVSWTGDRLGLPLEKQGTAGFMEYAIKVNDTGEAFLPKTFFDKLPPSAIFSLFLIRGNISVVSGIDHNQYKIYNQAETQLVCVLK